jgi:hypothetical protein
LDFARFLDCALVAFRVTLAGRFVRCCGGLLATTPAARSKRSHASGNNSTSGIVGFFIMNNPRVHYQAIDEHAHAIGYVCITWAILETELDKLLSALAPLEPGEPGESVLGNSNIRDKVKMLKALGFIRKPVDDWYNDLEKVLNLIDQDLRIARNQYIHDLWINQVIFVPDGQTVEPQVAKRTRGAKVINVQSRTRKLALFKDVPTKADEIWNFADTIRNTGVQIAILLLHYHGHLGSRALAEANAQSSPGK